MLKLSKLALLIVLALCLCPSCKQPTLESSPVLPTNISTPTDIPTPANTLTPTYTPIPTNTPVPTNTPKPTIPPEELKDKWRIPFRAATLTFGAYKYLFEIVDKLEAGEIDSTATLGQMIGPGILLMATDGILTEWEPTPDQITYKDSLLNYVSIARNAVSQLTNEEITIADIPGLLDDDYAGIKEVFQGIKDDMKGDGLSDDDITAMADELVQALEATTNTATPEPTEPVIEPDSFASGGLGLSKAAWEQTHKLSEKGYIDIYDNGKYLVTFVDDKVQYLEVELSDGSKLSPEDARAMTKPLLPQDSQFVETYTHLDTLLVDIYTSKSLKERFEPDWWFGSEPGTFITIYGLFSSGSKVTISTGNNP